MFFFSPDVPEESFVGCIDISGIQLLFLIFSLVCMCDFYSYIFIIFSRSFFKGIISIHVLNICVRWLRVSCSADHETILMSASESI